MKRTVQGLLQKAETYLANRGWGKDEAHLDASVLLASILQVDRSWLVGHDSDEVGILACFKYGLWINRRSAHEPVAYITGYKEFYGRRFYTDPRALIPRPETELMVQEVLKHIPSDADRVMLIDIGTGTGAIAITLALERPSLKVLATDISSKALQLAKQNASSYSTIQSVEIKQADLLDKSAIKEIVSRHPISLVITANLPYLPWDDVPRMQKDVVQFEPHSALFANQNGNELISKLLHQVNDFLKTFSLPLVLLAELDPPQANFLKKQAQELFADASVSVLEDDCGRPRLLKIVV